MTRRLLRILLNAATAVSLVLCVATAILFSSGFRLQTGSRWQIAASRGTLRIDDQPRYERELDERLEAWERQDAGTPHDSGATRLERLDYLIRNSPPGWNWPAPIETHVVPFGWLVATILTAILPVAWIIRVVRAYCRPGRGFCPACGYDLRATPDRCPECGTAPPAAR